MKILSTTPLAALALISATAVAQDLPYHGDGHVIDTSKSLEWRDVPSMTPGAKISVLEGNLAEENPFTFRLKLPADYRLAPHVHPAYERVTVLQGELHFAHGRKFDRAATTALPAGGFAVMAPG